MDGYRTFPTDVPPLSPRMAKARVDGQDQMLGQVAGDLFQHLTYSTARQEAELTQVYRPYVAAATARVDDQQVTLDGLAAVPVAAVQTGVAVQTGILSAIDPNVTPSGWPCGTVAPWLPDPGNAVVAAANGYFPGNCAPDPPDSQGYVTLTDRSGNGTFRVPACPVPCPIGTSPPPVPPPLAPPVPPPFPPPPFVPPVNPPQGCPPGAQPWNVPPECVAGLGPIPLSTYASLEQQIKSFNTCDWKSNNPGKPYPLLPFTDKDGNFCKFDMNTWSVVDCALPLNPPGLNPQPTAFPGQCGGPSQLPPVPPVPPYSPPPVPAPPTCPPPTACPTPAPPPVSPPPPPPRPAEPPWVGGSWCEPDRYLSILAEMLPPPAPVRAIVNPIDAPFVWMVEAGERAWDAVFGSGTAGKPSLNGSISSYRVSESLAGWAGRVTGADISYHATSAKYSAQYLDPQYIPTRDELIDLYHKGQIRNDRHYDALCRANGHCSFYSLALLDAGKPRLGLPEMVALNRRGFWSDQTFKEQTAKIGYWDEFYTNSAWNLSVFQFDALDAVKLWWRGEIDTPVLKEYLNHQGLVSDRIQTQWINLQTFLPPPGDAIMWAVKDVFDPNDIGRAERAAEFEQQVGLKETFAASGIFPTQIADGRGGKMFVDSPLNYWLAHYQEISPTQSFEMLHRLRPGRTGRFPLTDDAGKTVYPDPMTMTLVRGLLKKEDYSPIWRDRLAAISSATIGRIDLRRVYTTGGFGKPLFTMGYDYLKDQPTRAVGPAEVELYERYRDDKYVPEDAILLSWFTSYSEEQVRLGKTRTRRVGAICRAYKTGAIDRQRAEQQFAFTVQFPEDAKRLIDLCDAELANDLLSSATAGIKRQYVAGELSEREARQALVKTGMATGHIDRLLENWANNRIGKRRYETAQQIAAWYLEGLLDRREAMQRLQNIGFESTNAFRILRHAEIGQLAKSAKEQQRIATARQRAIEKAGRERDKELKDQQTEQAKVMARFLSARTIKNLTDWLKDGTISQSDVYSTFALKGMSRADADRVIAHALRPASKPKGGGP